MEIYKVRKFVPKKERYEFDVPASKSLLNRALPLAAFSRGEVFLSCGAFGGDTRAMLACLDALGIRTEKRDGGVKIYGCGGNIPNKRAELNVSDAGTAARFLPAMLAFCGGDYLFRASAQMSARPMKILGVLERAGARVEYLERSRAFPFRLLSSGIDADRIEVDTGESTQYLSGLLLAASVGKKPVTLLPTGGRTNGSYVLMTEKLLSDFGVKLTKEGSGITVFPGANSPATYVAEGDLSGACYFFALALLFGVKTLVRRVSTDTVQGDVKFLRLLQEKGVRFTDTPEGLLADGEGISSFTGFDADFRDFSDQTLTAAALAPFASTPSVLRNVAHIRRQECDRVAAIVENINALGGRARSDGNNVYIDPLPLSAGRIRTFGDHRVAMAFSLSALKTGGEIENPACCKKTFENYFDLIDGL